MSHLTVRQLLLKRVAFIFNPLASGLDVVDADTNVAEAFPRVRIPIGNLEIFVVLGSIVVGEFEHALKIGPVRICAGAVRCVVS